MFGEEKEVRAMVIIVIGSMLAILSVFIGTIMVYAKIDQVYTTDVPHSVGDIYPWLWLLAVSLTIWAGTFIYALYLREDVWFGDGWPSIYLIIWGGSGFVAFCCIASNIVGSMAKMNMHP